MCTPIKINLQTVSLNT